MAVLSVQTVDRGGIQPSFSAAAAGGDSCHNDGKTWVEVKNSGGVARQVTVVTQKTVDGQAVADRTLDVTVPAGGSCFFGGYQQDVYNDQNNRMSWTYDSEADLTVAAFKLSAN